MKKMIMVVMVLMMTMGMTGCLGEQIDYSEQLEAISEDIKQIEILEVEVPVIVVETEVVVIKVPQIIVETEIVEIVEEVEVEVLVLEESRTMFYTADTDLAIFVISMGEISYVIEFKFVDPLIGESYYEMVQIESQLDGYSYDWFFMSEHSENEDGEMFVFPVEDYYDFISEMDELAQSMTWEDIEFIYEQMSNDYYNTPTTLEVDQIAEFDVVYEGELLDYYDTYVYQLELEVGIEVLVTITTNAEIDVNGYDNTIVWYDYFDYATFTTTTNVYTFECWSGGTYYFEVEQFNDVIATYTITFSSGGDTA